MYSIIWKGELPKRMTIFYLTIGRIAKETHKISHRMDKTVEKLLDLQPQRNRRARATSSMIEANQAEDAQHQKKKYSAPGPNVQKDEESVKSSSGQQLGVRNSDSWPGINDIKGIGNNARGVRNHIWWGGG